MIGFTPCPNSLSLDAQKDRPQIEDYDGIANEGRDDLPKAINRRRLFYRISPIDHRAYERSDSVGGVSE